MAHEPCAVPIKYEENIKSAMADKSMKTLKFRHHLAEEIIAGRKTVTWRLFDDKDLKIDDKLELIDWESGEKFAKCLFNISFPIYNA